MLLQLKMMSALFNKFEYKKIITLVRDELSKLEDRTDAIRKINPRISYYYALSLVNEKEYDEAIEVLTYVIESNLGIAFNYQCKMLRGYLFTHCGQYRNAELEFIKLIENGYESVMIYAALGHIALKLRKQHDTISYLEKALKIDPNNLNALNSMSFALTEYDIDLDKASVYIEKVLKLDPRNPTYLDTYGYILLKQRKYDEAIKVLEYAYKYAKHPLIKQHLEAAKEKHPSIAMN